jgi:hypothetical protein
MGKDRRGIFTRRPKVQGRGNACPAPGTGVRQHPFVPPTCGATACPSGAPTGCPAGDFRMPSAGPSEQATAGLWDRDGPMPP